MDVEMGSFPSEPSAPVVSPRTEIRQLRAALRQAENERDEERSRSQRSKRKADELEVEVEETRREYRSEVQETRRRHRSEVEDTHRRHRSEVEETHRRHRSEVEETHRRYRGEVTNIVISYSDLLDIPHRGCERETAPGVEPLIKAGHSPERAHARTRSVPGADALKGAFVAVGRHLAAAVDHPSPSPPSTPSAPPLGRAFNAHL